MQPPRPKTFGEEELESETETGDDFRAPKIPSVLAHVGVVAFALLAAGAMFLLPALRDAGLSFLHAFLAVASVEMTAGVGAGYAALNLYLDPGSA